MFVNGHYLALGELGTILTSADGTNWVAQPSATTVELNDCAYGAGKYVVVGDFGTVLTSPDATNWTAQYSGTFYSLNGVAFANGEFVCVGQQTTILISSEGVSWTPQSSGPWELRDVIYAGGLFIAAGGDEAVVGLTGVRVLLTSTNGQMWTSRVLAYGQPFDSLAYGNGSFAATTSADPWFGLTPLWTSTNGVDWQAAPATAPANSKSKVTYGSGKWVLAFGNADYYWWPGQVLVSDDLINWDSMFTNSVSLLGICYGGGQFVAARADGAFLLSSNTVNWENPWPDPGLAPLQDLKFLNGRFWGLAYDRFAFSPDGVQWTNTAGPTNTGPLFGIAYGNGRYVAGGEYRTVWTSTDGENWTNPDTNLSIYPYSGEVRVEYGNGLFVGVGGNKGDILTSTNGLSWQVQQLSTNASVYFRDIAFGNGRFVAVSEAAFATSTDGTNWFFSNTNQAGSKITCGGGRFVIVGNSTIATSTDGTNWQVQTSSEFGPLSDVAYGAGWFAATTGVISSNPTLVKQPNLLWVSADGIHWTPRLSPSAQGIGPIAFGDGAFVVGTQNGGILQSDPMVKLSIKDTLPPILEISGPLHRQYQIERCGKIGSTNDWSPLGAVTITNDPGLFTDWSGTNAGGRFYRAVLLP